MSTLDKEAHGAMQQQIDNAKGKLISKEEVLRVLHEKLKTIDQSNGLIVDRTDGYAVKELINEINAIEP